MHFRTISRYHGSISSNLAKLFAVHVNNLEPMKTHIQDPSQLDKGQGLTIPQTSSSRFLAMFLNFQDFDHIHKSVFPRYLTLSPSHLLCNFCFASCLFWPLVGPLEGLLPHFTAQITSSVTSLHNHLSLSRSWGDSKVMSAFLCSLGLARWES